MGKRFYILVLLLTLAFTANCQSIFSTIYNMDNGLSNNRVNAITQDKNGFMWFGTDDGLCRFDGIKFKTYILSDYIDENASSYITHLFIDSKNMMWIGTNNGIIVFDYINNKFKAFKAFTGDSIKIATPILDIAEDKDGNVWIGTDGQGVFKFNLNEKQRLTSFNYSGNKNVNRKMVTTICEDSKNNIWFGTYSDGLYRYNKNTGKITQYKANGVGNCLSDNTIHKIYEDSHGNLWIGTFQNGLDKFDYETETFRNYKDNSTDNLLYHIHDITEFSPGNLLVASDNGVCYFTTDDMKIKRADDTSIKFRFSPEKFIYSIFIDKEQSLWLGSYFAGIQFFSPYQSNFKYFKCTGNGAGKVVNCIAKDGDRGYFIGTDDDGIYRFDPTEKTTKPYRTAKDINSTYYCIHDILIDGDLMYAATYERGLEVTNLKTGQMISYLNNPKDSTTIHSSKIFKLMKASDGRIYIGTADGLCYYKKTTREFIRVGELKGIVQAITEDNNGMIWAGSKTNGLMRYDVKNNKCKIYRHNGEPNSLPQNAISALCLDNNKRLWVGLVGKGLCLYDSEKDGFVKCKGLELPNNIVSSIIAYGDNLWISTNKGISNFNPGKNITKSYSKSSGLINEQFTTGASLVTDEGEIMLGTVNGFCVFQPQGLRENSYNAPLKLTNVTIMGNTVDNVTNELSVSYDQSMIGMDFSVLSYTSPKDNSYQYMLEGLDSDWIKARGENNHISYNKLPAGKYTLKIKGQNSDGIDCKNEIRLGIEVKPPFLRSNTAYLLYSIALLCIIFLSIRYYIIRSHKKQKKNLMKLTREKEKELYNSKIEFFTNIAHEIRTPLSLIIGPLDHLMKTTDINDKYGDYLNIIEHNYKRLYTLVNQLLDFRKVDSGVLEFAYRKYNLKELVRKTYTVFELSIKQKNLKIDTSGIADNFEITTDEESFIKIMSNLISNAIKYAKKTISISAERQNNNLVITVTDDGPGIEENEKKKIFEAFYQIKRNNDSQTPGIGIGLHIANTVAQMMNGNITVDNRKDGVKGVCFTVTLPVVEIEEAEEKKNATVNKDSKDENPEIIKDEKIEDDAEEAVSKKKVVIIDDNPDILDFLDKVLSSRYFIITAGSGEEGLALLESNKPDIVVSDVMMEGIDGFEVCKRIKSNINISHIPVILLTAKTDTESKVEGLEAGADAYIEKPFAASHLIAQIDNLLKKKEEYQRAFASNPLSEVHAVSQNKLDEDFIEQCTKIILDNLDNTDFSINSLAQELNMSRTSVFTKIKGIMGMTPNDFIKVTKLKTAAKLLAESKYRISEITYIVGFSSSSYFAKCFQKQFGILPTDFVKNLKGNE